MLVDHAALHDLAIDAVTQAMSVCRLVQGELNAHRHMTKDDRSPVTIADYASQAIVAAILAEGEPEVPLVAEESAEFLRQPEHAAHLAATVDALRRSGVWPGAGEREVLLAVDRGGGEPRNDDRGFWTLDPIDGTKGFLRGEQYCVSLAYIRRGRVEIGVLGCPNLRPGEGAIGVAHEPAPGDSGGSMYAAVLGDGASMLWEQGDALYDTLLEREPMAADQPARLAESVEAAHTRQEVAERVMALAGPTLPAIRVDSQCKYALVARGDADVYLRLPSRKGYVERIWDHAAGMLIASEAGCVVTDVLGRPLDFSRGRGLEGSAGIVGAPAGLHGRLIGALAELKVGQD